MPTISQLPQATSISAADTLPLSQEGRARAASVGALLASTQPAITVQTGSLLGRTSLGAGSPEQVSIGPGVSLSAGTLAANGLDHAGFPAISDLATDADLVICNQGTPMLMPASLLRRLFAAGQNVRIAADGTISASATGTIALPWQFKDTFRGISVGYEFRIGKAKRRRYLWKRKNCQSSDSRNIRRHQRSAGGQCAHQPGPGGGQSRRFQLRYKLRQLPGRCDDRPGAACRIRQ